MEKKPKSPAGAVECLLRLHIINERMPRKKQAQTFKLVRFSPVSARLSPFLS